VSKISSRFPRHACSNSPGSGSAPFLRWLGSYLGISSRLRRGILDRAVQHLHIFDIEVMPDHTVVILANGHDSLSAAVIGSGEMITNLDFHSSTGMAATTTWL